MLKICKKLQEKRFVFVKILAIIIPENGAKVSKIKCLRLNQQTLIKNQIPWGLIIMVCGMAMLMGEAGNLGVTETISALLESGSLPASAIIPFIAAVCGFLSLFVSGGVITPLIIALAPALVSYGVSGAAIIVASQMGMIATSISPYSMGGAICITGCPEKYSSKVGNQQLMLAIMMGVIVTLLAILGVFN